MAEKGINIKDISENSKLEGLFLVKDKNNGVTRQGKPYIALNISDKTGTVKCRIWDNADALGRQFSSGDIVKIKAYSLNYRGALQLNISAIERITDNSTSLQDFLPASPYSPDDTFRELMHYVQLIENPHLKMFIETLFSDPDTVKGFKAAPAAKSIHHDYLGGLLDHTFTVTRIAYDLSSYYPHVDRDILVTGAIIHDIGKIYELSYERSFEYSDAGRLIGHITLGVEIINQTIEKITGFPEDLALVIKHLMLSHHGQYDFGSPKRPKTLEAMLLSYIDDIDAKMYGLAHFIKQEKQPETKWTGYHKLFDRYIYTDTFIDTDEGGAEPPENGDV